MKALIHGTRPALLTALLVLSAGLTGAVAGDDFSLDWWTIDGGGEMFTSGGNFEMSGTIGQPDANLTSMTGGEFELTGGFWAGVPPFQVGDLNCDGHLDGFDIDAFVALLTGG